MISSSLLLADLKKQLKALEADLRTRSEEPDVAWAANLMAEYEQAFAHGRTANSWEEWREGELSQAAVAWIIASTFIRFCEDNDLLVGAREAGRAVALPWIAGPGEGVDRAVENQNVFYAANPTLNGRDWLQSAFNVLASLPAGRSLVDPEHSPVWSIEISAAAADSFLGFWRDTDANGELVHDFTDESLDTRFLGDLYQDLSDYAKKTFALLQTPDFIETFILDQTLTPAIAEFGLDGLKLIDPTCGSGHFLLGAFARLNEAWQAHAPALEPRERVKKALESISGVDLNPFAVAIARFRLTIAAIEATGERNLASAPEFNYRLAVGDSLLLWDATNATLDIGDEEETFAYSSEDVRDYVGILERGQYHVVVGNPPYIQVKDKALNQRYREIYSTCSGKYALSIPFMELFFQLARTEDASGGAGYVGKITSNSFMKREFGKKVIAQFLSGAFNKSARVDLTGVIDTSGAYIPGHGTPTVILFGRRRRPVLPTVRAALGVRGEPGQPFDPANGLAWRDIADHLEEPGYNGTYVSIADLDRQILAAHPWSLSGGGAGELKEIIDSSGESILSQAVESMGITSFTLEDDVYVRPAHATRTQGIPDDHTRLMVMGDSLRDWSFSASEIALFPYDVEFEPVAVEEYPALHKAMWPFRSNLSRSLMFGRQTKVETGLNWSEYGRLSSNKLRTPLSITFAFVATHNHFVLDRGGKVFNRSAPVIKLPADATEDDHYDLLGLLNSSTACFWLKQVSHNKGEGGGARVDAGYSAMGSEPWKDTYEFTSTKLAQFPIPLRCEGRSAKAIDDLARERSDLSPNTILKSGRGVLGQLSSYKEDWERSRELMVFHQEELDWATYAQFNLTAENLVWGGEPIAIRPEERGFEIALARSIAQGASPIEWFARHGRQPEEEIPDRWPAQYRELVQRRLDALESNRNLRLLERPEYKRRWATPSWESQLKDAAAGLALDRLESREYWHDSNGRPVARSAAQLADLARNDDVLKGALEILAGTVHIEIQPAIESLLAEACVPNVAAARFKPSGSAKFRVWQQVWNLQRAEDRGEQVSIPVPPKYKPTDFRKTTYWQARGKLDVPKERFISYPGALRANDGSPVYGWAGWDHAAQGLAASMLINDMSQAGAGVEQITPLLAGLVELEPWIHQWHSDVDPAFGQSPAAAITGMLETTLARHSLTRDHVTEWTPSAATRGRRASATPTTSSEETP